MAARRIAQLIPSRPSSITLDESGVRAIPYGRARRFFRRGLPLFGLALAVTVVWVCVLWLA